MTDQVPRRVLVIASQCKNMRELSFLPDAARDFYAAMIDPKIGACAPALAGSGLILDPLADAAVDALIRAFKAAAADAAVLFVALIGHGVKVGNTFFFLVANSHDPEKDWDFRLALDPVRVFADVQSLDTGIDGFVMLIDACTAGPAATQAAREWPDQAARAPRFEVLTASSDTPAYNGCFTRTITRLIRQGRPDTTVPVWSAVALRDEVSEVCKIQLPRLVSVDPSGAFFVARNTGLSEAAAPWVGGPTADEIEKLTRDFHPVGALVEIAAAVEDHPEGVHIVGKGEHGKSTLVAALARPELTNGAIPECYLAAAAFINRATTSDQLAMLLADQLERSVRGFEIARPLIKTFGSKVSETWAELGPFDRELIVPLKSLAELPAPVGPVRIAVDGLDRVGSAGGDLSRGLTRLAALEAVRLITTARPNAPSPEGAYIFELGPAVATELSAYFTARGFSSKEAATLAERAGGSWLTARQLADTKGLVSATSLFDTQISTILSDNDLRWEQLTPVLTPLVAAGSGPTLPVEILVRACESLGGPASRAQVHDLLIFAHGLIVWSEPGTEQERVGLFHQSLSEFLAEPASSFHVNLRAGHEAILAAITSLESGNELPIEDPVRRYATATAPEHLWALGQYEDATAARRARKFAEPRDNLSAWQRWAERAAQTADADQRLGLLARHGVAYWTGMAGRPSLGRDQCSALLTEFKGALGVKDRETLTLRRNIALFTDRAGNASSARDLARAVRDDRAHLLGPDDRETLASSADLAIFTGNAGERARARDQLRELVDHRARVVGRYDPDTLATRGNFAFWTGEAGDPAEALRLFTVLLPDRARFLGRDHPDTLNARGSIAQWTGEAGNAREALRLLTELLPDRERVLGPDHPSTLTTRYRHAHWTGHAGDARAALRLVTELLPDRERVLGPDHPEVLATRAAIATWTGLAGKPAEALRLLTTLLPDQQRVLGPDHPDTLELRGEIAYATFTAGKPAEALRLFTTLLPDLQRVLGPLHPDTLTTRGNIAALTGEAGDSDEALRLFQALLPEREALLGPDHPDTLSTRGNIAGWTGEADPAGALRLYEALLPEYERTLGHDHPETLETRSNIAAWAGRVGDPTGALRLFEALLPDYERTLGRDHPETLNVRSNVAYWAGRAGDPAGALRLYEALLPDYERTLGPDHPATIAICQELDDPLADEHS